MELLRRKCKWLTASLLPAGNDVIWSAHLGSPGYTERNLAERLEIKSYYVITIETLAHKSIYDHLINGHSRRDNKCELVKGAIEGQILKLALAANAMQMQRECIKGAPA